MIGDTDDPQDSDDNNKGWRRGDDNDDPEEPSDNLSGESLVQLIHRWRCNSSRLKLRSGLKPGGQFVRTRARTP